MTTALPLPDAEYGCKTAGHIKINENRGEQ